MSVALNGASLAISVVAIVFFIVGCIGYTVNEDTLKEVAWAITEINGVDFYIGLRLIYLELGSANFDVRFSECTEDFCDDCNLEGKGTFALLIIAIGFATITLSLCAALLVSPSNSSMQTANVFMSLLSAIASLIGFSIFMGHCYPRMYRNFNEDDDSPYYYGDDDNSGKLKWGPGSILSIIGMLLMWIVTILQIAAAVVGSAPKGAEPVNRHDIPAGL